MKTTASGLYYAAAASTAIAGMLHLMLGPGMLGFSVNQAILFIVGGLAQIFWIIPIVGRLGRGWYAVGLVGTVAFVALFLITRVSGNPITGRGGGANPISLTIEIFQALFIALSAAILWYEFRARSRQGKIDGNKPNVDSQNSKAWRSNSKKALAIVAGIAAVLALAALFILPMAMPGPVGSRGGLPPRGGLTGAQEQFGVPGSVVPPHPQESAQHVGTIATTHQICTLTPSLIEVEDTPQQIEGPYFVDEKINHSDIREDPTDGSIQQGVPIQMTLNVYDVDNGGTCIPIKGAMVDVWQANAQGLYSDIQSIGTSGTKYLRGYQITNDNGTAKFTTIYPGWYEGRALHIHFKVRTYEGTTKTLEFTSQLYLNDTISDKVLNQAPYITHGPRPLKNTDDLIFTGPSTDGLVKANAGSHLLLHLVPSGNGVGYQGTFDIGLKRT